MIKLEVWEFRNSPSDVTFEEDSIEIEITHRSQYTMHAWSIGVDDKTAAVQSS